MLRFGWTAESLCRCLPRLKRCFAAAPVGFVRDETLVINTLNREQVIKGVPVAHIDESGHGVVHIHVRKDKETFQFSYPRALPGEKLNLVVRSVKKDKFKKKEAGRYRLAINERCSASVNEVTPRCQHFSEKCGGCAFQNLKYEAQLWEKFGLLQMRLKEYDLKPKVLWPPEKSNEAYGWHARTEFRFFLREGLQLGLHPEGSPVPLALSKCHLHPNAAHEVFQAILAAARAEKCVSWDERTGRGWLCQLVLRSSRPKATTDDVEVLATLVTVEEAPRDILDRVAAVAMKTLPQLVGVTWSKEGGETTVQSPSWRSFGLRPQELLAGRPFLLCDLMGLQLKLSPEAFFRPNLFLTDAVLGQVLEMAQLDAETEASEVLWDTFCGQGLFTLAFRHRHPQLRVVSIDRSGPALQQLQLNLDNHGLEDVDVVQGDLGVPAFLHRLTAASDLETSVVGEAAENESEDEPEEAEALGRVHESLPETLPAPSILLADPGRNGMPKAFRRQLLELKVPKLLYISSGRAFLRDVAYLTTKRGYRLQDVRCFDLQPHTAKFEACPLHLGCWFLFHGSFSFHLLALGLMHCFGALMVYLLVEEAELENFNVLRKLTLEQKYMETMHSSLQGMLSSIFEAWAGGNEEGDIRCWAQSPHRNDEAETRAQALLSLVNVTSLLDLSLDPKERESITDFLQRMSVKAASSTERVGTLTLKLKKAVPLEVQLTGIKVPARRSGLLEAFFGPMKSAQCLTYPLKTNIEIVDFPRFAMVPDGAGILSGPGTPQSNKAKSLDEPPVLRLPSKSRESRENRENRELPVLKHADTGDTACLADDEGRERMVLQRPGARSAAGPSRLQQRAKGKGLTLGMDCNKITRETTETFVDAHDHYEMLEQLGRGSVATVRKAIRKKDGLVVSLKISGSKDKSALVEAEFKILQSIKHPNIIRAFDYLETSVSSILVLEYFDGSSLEEAVHQSSLGHFPELTARELFRALLSAVCYLHSHRIIHRDVKPSNVMVSAGLSDLRLLDFNVAKRLTEGGSLTVTGTRLYFAPEVINGEPPSEANDVWGCGICVFYMLAGRLPWKNLPEGVFVDHPELKVQGSWCHGENLGSHVEVPG
ncbi:unnamed protein product [Cladocopium goreaui]|uniref:tRNA(Phe) (4-demethylwyosine(37)-C(7)) aminocarboxypropyltransferase n=1 Tax=Cladocopium goreaui TaxID=2562237 RepID=A0A9P1CMC6_9DINO|nr:unnamed protein product [Cladocopium goreaui]